MEVPREERRPRRILRSMTEHDAGDGERRDAERRAIQIPVRFRSLDELATAYSSDVSKGGMYVAAVSPLAVGTEVALSIEIPDGRPAAIVPARVAYVLGEVESRARGKPPGMGMQFLARETTELAQRIAAHLATAFEADAPGDRLSLRVLVVEDSPTYRDALVGALLAAGHRVSVAEDGLAGLGKALKERPDIVLSDVNMPTMDGWQMLRLLRARAATQRIPVVFLSTLGSERDRLRGYDAGVDDYIAKPFDADDLAVRIQRVAARAAARSESASEPSVTALSGDLRLVSLPSVLAFVEAERRRGVLTVRGPSGDLRIGVLDGSVIRVDLPQRDAPASLLERLVAALDTVTGRFEFSALTSPDSGEAVSIQRALLEHARRRDESAR
jgi:uncharacterized protein (TIGR02266 family)